MAARTWMFAAGLGLTVFAAGGWALDDTHGAHDAPAATHAPTKPAAAKPEPAKSEQPKETAKTDEPKAPAATKPPAEFGPGPAASKKEPAAKPAKPAIEAVDGPISTEEALRLLREGNERWVAANTASPATETSRRRAAAEGGQHPFATILTCADSRLPVERLFDRGVGELFVLRVAGNVVGSNEAGTIEYGAEHLNVPLLVIMGHSKCGAVAAATTTGHAFPPNITGLIEHIEPAVARARKTNPAADDAELAAAAVRENVWQSIFDLIRSSGPVRAQLREGKLKIVGAVCDVADGRVQWLGEHPWQEELVAAFDARNAARQTVAEVGEPAAH